MSESARWKIERAEHQEIALISRIDNLLNAAALFVLGYVGLREFFFTGETNEGLVAYAVPILNIVIASVTAYNCTINALFGYLLATEAVSELKATVSETLPMIRPVILIPNVVRATAFPMIIALLWGFIMAEFDLADNWIAILFPILGIVAAVLLGVLVVFIAWKYRHEIRGDETPPPPSPSPVSTDGYYLTGRAGESETVRTTLSAPGDLPLPPSDSTVSGGPVMDVADDRA
ncbi:hypothetical protein KIPB_002108 [Kipferlia bialata]|uniref:Uncharacterized protein n=1 Tax=Kipferlia bialata TaxID=797122 RepID=A0A9K3CRT0_9EUKA|nr:hypothetical protein KIPB_002108 [Kipferlia bialata]|eukprot:g2108.t1